MCFKMAQTSKRAQNWEAHEKDVLLQLVLESVHIIESKQGDNQTNRRKADEWKRIEQSFNAQCGVQRKLQSLKDWWKRAKIKAKEEYRVYEKSRKQTGGGPAPKEPSSISVKIKELLPDDFKQNENPFDDDYQEIVGSSNRQENRRDVGIISESETDVEVALNLSDNIEVFEVTEGGQHISYRPKSVNCDDETASDISGR